tara:strand:- start:902 stop:1297 length:396 start_codon:yes stop_codon:yes gene_type:complete
MSHEGHARQVGLKKRLRKSKQRVQNEQALQRGINPGPQQMFRGGPVGKVPQGSKPQTFQEIVANAPKWWKKQFAEQSPAMQKIWWKKLKFLSRFGVGDRESLEASWQKRRNENRRIEPQTRKRVSALRNMT